MEKRLVSLLNSSKSGNLPVEDQLELGELVEYFAHDHCLDNGWDGGSDSEFKMKWRRPTWTVILQIRKFYIERVGIKVEKMCV